MPDSCLFCRIIRKELSATKVYEDSHFLAFLDIHPANPGHTLVVFKRHAPNLMEEPEAELGGFTGVVKKIAIAQTKALGATGVNVLMNNGAPAGQIIFHTHAHVIPRFDNDGLDLKWPRLKYEEGEVEQVAKKIAEAIPR